MPRSPASTAAIQSRILSLLCGAGVVAALYFGKEILLPFAIAVLLSFMLAPLVDRLERVRVPRTVAVVGVVALALMAFAALSFVLAQQLYDLAYDLPNYRDKIVAKARAFQASDHGVVERVGSVVEAVRKTVESTNESEDNGAADDDSATDRQGSADQAVPPSSSANEPETQESVNAARDGEDVISDPREVLERAAEGAAPLNARPPAENESEEGDASDEPVPVPVTVVEQLTARDVAQGVLGPLVAPLGKVALVTIFVLFMLLAREDLRNRIIQLFGARQLNTTTQAIDDAARRVSRYLLMQLVINVCYGVVIALGLYLIGLPSALLWGALTTIFRFVPFVGPWIAAVMPIALSLAVFDGWTKPLVVIALFVVNELISNNVFEPWLYGTSTGISTFGIIVSATFWTWLWGPVGLILATPLTVCLTVLGRYVPQLSFLNTLIGEEESLPPASRLYQRLLALDPEEAQEVAEEYLEDHTLEDLYDDVLLQALSLAERDRHRDELDERKELFVLKTIRELIEELDEKAPVKEKAPATADRSPDATHVAPKASIACLPARDEADEVVGLMLAKLLAARDVTMTVMPAATLASEMLEKLSSESAKIVCVSALPPHAATHARYLCKRLRPRLPDLKITVGLWETDGTATKSQERLMATGIDTLVTTLTMAADHFDRLASSQRGVQQSA